MTEGGRWSHRSSYPDRKEDEDEDDGGDEEPPDQKTLEYDEETLELTLPSGEPQDQRVNLSEGQTSVGQEMLPRTRGRWSAGLEPLISINTCSCVSGAKIGHRSLMRYYRQRFGAERAVVPSHSRTAVGRVLRQYRALGWGGEGESFSPEPCLSFRGTPVSWDVG